MVGSPCSNFAVFILFAAGCHPTIPVSSNRPDSPLAGSEGLPRFTKRAGVNYDNRPASLVEPQDNPTGIRPPPIGDWTKDFEDGCWVDLSINENQLQFLFQLKDNVQLTLEGTYSVTGVGLLSGVMTRLRLKGENYSIKSELGKPFDLWFIRRGSDLIITNFKGGGWNEGNGEENMRGRYRVGRHPAVESKR